MPETTTLRATGSFEVDLRPQTPNEHEQAAGVGRMTIDKRFEGDLVATSVGEMLAAMTPFEGSAGYVAIERVSGALRGRKGSFVLQHTGLMDGGQPSLVITVVPDSGTGELAGLSGTMTIDTSNGGHAYVFAYEIQSGK
ncbi:MAG: DUF3224 domain-containing protein [Thermoflexales bacterium]